MESEHHTKEVNNSDYAFNNCSNDCNDWEYSTSFATGAVISAGGTYTVCHGSFAGEQSLCDELRTLYHNGNDAQGLVYVPTGEVLDVIGDTIGSAEYWSVAGVSSGTKDHTLVRKCSVEQGNTDWTASAGTDADDSEWIVLDNNDWSDLGLHTTPCEVAPSTVSVAFSVDMNSLDQPSADYDNVVINGTWNGWQGWGVTLSDADADGVWTGTGEFDPAIGQFEYVVAVTGPADSYSG